MNTFELDIRIKNIPMLVLQGDAQQEAYTYEGGNVFLPVIEIHEDTLTICWKNNKNEDLDIVEYDTEKGCTLADFVFSSNHLDFLLEIVEEEFRNVRNGMVIYGTTIAKEGFTPVVVVEKALDAYKVQ